MAWAYAVVAGSWAYRRLAAAAWAHCIQVTAAAQPFGRLAFAAAPVAAARAYPCQAAAAARPCGRLEAAAAPDVAAAAQASPCLAAAELQGYGTTAAAAPAYPYLGVAAGGSALVCKWVLAGWRTAEAPAGVRVKTPGAAAGSVPSLVEAPEIQKKNKIKNSLMPVLAVILREKSRLIVAI